jgi:hypothetical protein
MDILYVVLQCIFDYLVILFFKSDAKSFRLILRPVCLKVACTLSAYTDIMFVYYDDNQLAENQIANNDRMDILYVVLQCIFDYLVIIILKCKACRNNSLR